MAIVLQGVVGAAHGERFYPDFAGVGRSHNFYPTEPLKAQDGIVAVALGLGKTVVEGGASLRFCPRYPNHLLQFSAVTDVLRNSQREFWALRLSSALRSPTGEAAEGRFDLESAEADGTLHAVGSTYSRENDAIYDGLSRPGTRVVSFAPILKHETFPLANVVKALMEMGEWGMNAPVEIEFAVNLRVPRGAPEAVRLPPDAALALSREGEELDLGDVDSERGALPQRQRPRERAASTPYATSSSSTPIASTAGGAPTPPRRSLSSTPPSRAAGTPYLLIGVGRWGSRDPWLGIPVTWDQISGARAIVETGFKDLHVTPSQGSHFFQNIVSFNVGYFTVNPGVGERPDRLGVAGGASRRSARRLASATCASRTPSS